MVLGSRRSLSGSLRLGPGDDTDREAPGTLKSFVTSELLICIIECPPPILCLFASQNGNSPVTSLITGVLCNSYYNNKNSKLKNMNKLPLILLSRNNHLICTLPDFYHNGSVRAVYP